MKSKITFVAIVLIALVPFTLFAAGTDEAQPAAVVIPASSLDSPALTAVLDAPSATPLGPRDVLQAYQEEMTAITDRFTAQIAAIAEAVRNGQISSEEGQRITTERYQMAQMQFELVSAWGEMLEQDLDRNETAQPADSNPAAEQAQAQGPRSIDQELAHLTKDLELTPNQQKQIRPLLEVHHDRIQALLEKNPTLSHQALAPQIHAVSEQTHRDIEALLTKRQKRLVKAMQRRMHQGDDKLPVAPVPQA